MRLAGHDKNESSDLSAFKIIKLTYFEDIQSQVENNISQLL